MDSEFYVDRYKSIHKTCCCADMCNKNQSIQEELNDVLYKYGIISLDYDYNNVNIIISLFSAIIRITGFDPFVFVNPLNSKVCAKIEGFLIVGIKTGFLTSETQVHDIIEKIGVIYGEGYKQECSCTDNRFFINFL